jgi:hypothetical protein
VFSITQFGAPNGLCSSITKSKHIKAVNRPYCHSGKNKPLGQMLITNQCNDKLAAARTHFTSQGMLNGSPSSMANALLGIFSSGHNPQVDDIAHNPSSQLVLPHDHEDQHASINKHSHCDLRPEDGPEAGAEISLAKTYGTHYFSPFLQLFSPR